MQNQEEHGKDSFITLKLIDEVAFIPLDIEGPIVISGPVAANGDVCKPGNPAYFRVKVRQSDITFLMDDEKVIPIPQSFMTQKDVGSGEIVQVHLSEEDTRLIRWYIRLYVKSFGIT